MRVDLFPERNERRDALDQRVCSLVQRFGCLPIPIPNMGDLTTSWLERNSVDAVILSGGNDLVELGGDAPERDRTELRILHWAASRKIGVVGICRGAQLIARLGDSKIERSTCHAGTVHEIFGSFSGKVPSHHNWCITSVSDEFEVMAYAEDDTVEALRSRDRRMLGIMWHPERLEWERPDDERAILSVLRGEV